MIDRAWKEITERAWDWLARERASTPEEFEDDARSAHGLYHQRVAERHATTIWMKPVATSRLCPPRRAARVAAREGLRSRRDSGCSKTRHGRRKTSAQAIDRAARATHACACGWKRMDARVGNLRRRESRNSAPIEVSIETGEPLPTLGKHALARRQDRRSRSTSR